MARVFVESWHATYPGLLPDQSLLRLDVPKAAANYRQQVRRVRPREFHIVAARQTGEIIGLAHGGVARDRGLRVDGRPVDGEIFTLYVHPDAQGEGAGLALLEAAFDRFRGAGYTTAGLWMVRGNPTRFFYEYTGGRKIAEKPGREWGSPVQLEAYGWPRLSLEVSSRAGQV